MHRTPLISVLTLLGFTSTAAVAATDVIITGNGGDGFISLQQEDGTFGSFNRFTVNSGRADIGGTTATDLNGDGYLDLVGMGRLTGGYFTACVNDGSGAFDCTADSNRNTNGELVLADFTGDGVDDYFYIDGTDMGYCEYDVVDGFSCTSLYTLSIKSYFYPFATPADLDGDGDVDILVSNALHVDSAGEIVVCLNDGNLGVDCTSQTGFTGNMDPNLADFDGDGDIDAVIQSYGSHPIYCENDGTGDLSCAEDTSFGVGAEYYGRSYGYRSDAADIDGDGDIDLVLAYTTDTGNEDTRGVHVCLNDGGAAFDCTILDGVSGDQFADIQLGDIDCDGTIDFGHAGRFGTRLCFGDGAGDFSCSSSGSALQAPSVVLGDFDEAFVECSSAPDTDGDGVADDDDACPDEDATGYDTDGDGCLDDTDGDGLTDDLDFCPDGGNYYSDELAGGGGEEEEEGEEGGLTESMDPTDPGCDFDGDGTINDNDAFPSDASEDTDTDGDGVGDNSDAFPDDANETGDEDGDGVGDNSDLCSGYPNTDTDADGVCDDSDVCPTDADDADEDADGICDVDDVCVGSDNVDADGDQVCDDLDICDGNDAAGDADEDGVCSDIDNCPDDDNADQDDADGDDIGDACEADTDVDGVIDDDDNCPDDANSDQSDLDEDGEGDVCDDDDDGDGVADDEDNCPFYDNADQTDTDGDGLGDECDGDDDGDGVADDADLCAGTPLDSPFDANGCSGEQRIELVCGEPDDYGWNRRWKYVRCVKKESKSAWRAGLITKRERSHIVRRSIWQVWISYISRLRRWC